MTPTLVRQDTGDVLILDGVLTSRAEQPIEVSKHPVQRLSVMTDNAQVGALTRALEWEVTQLSMVPGVTRGPQRITGVEEWLNAVKGGIPLTLNEDAVTTRGDMFLERWAWIRQGTTSVTMTLDLVQAQIASTRTVTLAAIGGRGGGKTARKDVAAGLAEDENRGEQPTQSVLATSADTAISAVKNFFGP